MGRKVNHFKRISDSYDALAPLDKPELLAELFTRLDVDQADRAMQLMKFWRKTRSNGQPQEDKSNA